MPQGMARDFSSSEHGLAAIEQRGVDGHLRAVELEQAQAQCFQRIAGKIRKAEADEARRTVGDLGARKGVGHGCAALFDAHLVQHADEVGGGVEQRAVQIEEHAADIGSLQAADPGAMQMGNVVHRDVIGEPAATEKGS